MANSNKKNPKNEEKNSDKNTKAVARDCSKGDKSCSDG